MPDLPFDISNGQLDAQFGVLVLLLILALFALLAPVGRKPPRPGAPTEDTTKTRRLP